MKDYLIGRNPFAAIRATSCFYGPSSLMTQRENTAMIPDFQPQVGLPDSYWVVLPDLLSESEAVALTRG